MAIDSRISLAVQAPNVGQAFNNALLNVQGIESIQQAPLRSRLLEAQIGTAEAGQTESQQNNRIRSLAIFGTDIAQDVQSGNLASIRAKTLRRIAQDLPSQGLPSNDSQELLALIDDPNISEQDKLAQIGQLSQQAISTAQRFGVIKAPFGGLSAGQKERADLIADLSSDDPKVSLSASIALGLDPRAVGSSIQTISNLGTAGVIAATEETIAKGKEAGKLGAQLKFKPEIEKAVTLAREEARARGETLTDLARSEAALPGLLESVGSLKELAAIATSTFGGRVFDAAVKETGFGSTKGANARAKFTAIINNQILPLLRSTFGAAFTEREGESLRASMSDVDATPEQKILQLEAFIDQKVRSIQTSQREVGADITPASELVPAQGLTSGGIKFLGFE